MAASSVITAEMRRHIGDRLFPDFPSEEVTTWGIRRFCEATDDDNPLWQDEDYAKTTRWGGIVAPPLYLEAFNPSNHAFRRYPDMTHMSLPFDPPFPRTFQASNEFQMFVPLRPGDAISSTCSLGDIYEREGSGGGRMVFIRIDNEHRNQRNELVGISSETMVSLEGSPAAKKTGAADAPKGDTSAAAPPSREQVFFEDVEPGTRLPSVQRKVTLFSMLKWAAAVNDYGPHHFDHAFATDLLGLPNVIAHGPHNAAHLARLVTDWIGGEGVLRRHYVELRGNVFPGDELTVGGSVTAKELKGGEGVLLIEVWGRNQDGKRVCVGNSTVVLPRRSRST
jgi:acyl dehydratase